VCMKKRDDGCGKECMYEEGVRVCCVEEGEGRGRSPVFITGAAKFLVLPWQIAAKFWSFLGK